MTEATIGTFSFPIREQSSPEKRRAQIYFMHNFRAIAIMMVVISHCYDISWKTRIGLPSSLDFIINLLSGATALFVFIAGFFFHHVFSEQFNFETFLRDKSKKLLIPYLIITLLLLLTANLLNVDLILIRGTSGPWTIDFWLMFFYAAITGTAGPAMWYIPFIFIIFLLSPLFLYFCRASIFLQVGLLLTAFAVGLLINRAPFNLDKIQNVGYFSFYYLLGIFCSARMTIFVALTRRPLTLLLSGAGVILLAIGQHAIGSLDNPSGEWFEWTGFNIQYFQKLAWIVFLCGFLGRFGDRPLPIISQIAKWSFGIFFVHQFVLLIFKAFTKHFPISLGGKYLDLAFFSLVVLSVSIVLIWGITSVFGYRSRYIIGA